MSVLCEFIEPESIPFDMEHLTRQVLAVLYSNINRHLKDILLQWYEETLLYNNLIILNRHEFFSYLFTVKNLIPTLVFSSEDSIRYEKKGSYQYRLSFVPSFKLDKDSYKEFDKKDFFIDDKVITVYQPILFAHANITDVKLNSVSILTLVYIDNIPGFTDTYTKEFVTRLDDMDFMIKLKDGRYITEVYKKYIERKVSLDMSLDVIRNIVFQKIIDSKKNIQDKFNESVKLNYLDFLYNFDLFYHLDFLSAVKRINFDINESTQQVNVFHNHTDIKTVNPVFLFKNLAILYPPFIRLDVHKKSGDKYTYVMVLTIVIDNIPVSDKYVIINNSSRYVFTYSDSWEE